MKNETTRPSSMMRLILINVFVFVALLLLVEFGFRLFDHRPDYVSGQQWQQFRAFYMFANGQNTSGAWGWYDQYRQTPIPAQNFYNNKDGFAMGEELSFSSKRPKAANEKVVVLTGGSAMWGVGATSGATTIAGQLELKLNSAQTSTKYKVFNLGMGGWQSFQQFIALAMYGGNLHPDWVITMDGYNDGAVACAHQQGAGKPLYYAMMEAYMGAYTFGQVNPPAYRGRLENTVLKHSKAYRQLTNQQPIDFQIYVDPTQHGDPNAPAAKITGQKVTWQSLEDQLAFYKNSNQRIVDLFPGANILLTLQPISSDFSSAFGDLYQHTQGTSEFSQSEDFLRRRLDQISKANIFSACNPSMWPIARDYFFGRSDLMLRSLADENRRLGRNVRFVNTGVVLPNQFAERQNYLIDMMHLNDAGMERVASLYARMVLARDFPRSFKEPVLSGPAADADLFKAAIVEIDWMEPGSLRASYGESCKDTKAIIGTNSFFDDNASDAVRKECLKTKGECGFVVNVAKIGDPVNGCGKDFKASWVCKGKTRTEDVYLPAEANGKLATISCK
jgi:hypothetical protein